MQINKLNNIIFIKQPESNIIDEAFVILKDNVKITDFSFNNINTFKLDRADVQKETENIINQEIEENNLKFEKYKIEKLEKKIKWLKLINLMTIAVAVIVTKLF